MSVLNIQCIVASQWWYLHIPNLACFTTISYLPDHPLKKYSTAKFPAILDSFYTEVVCIRRTPEGWEAGALEGGKDSVQKLKRNVL